MSASTLFVEVADSPSEHERGLMDIESLLADEGMAFVFQEPTQTSFWMKDTLIPLSIAFVDEEGVVVGVRDMQPCEADPCRTYGVDPPSCWPSKRTSDGSPIMRSVPAIGRASRCLPISECLLCSAERITPWLFEDEDCWVAECMVCRTPAVVWRTHGLPGADVEEVLLVRLGDVAGERYGSDGYWIDPERRRIPDHWHAHARPAGGFFDPASDLYERYEGSAPTTT